MNKDEIIGIALENFITLNKKKINEYQGRLSKQCHVPISLDVAIRVYIADRQSIDRSAEIRDQRGEIAVEKWIIHEKDPKPTEEEIAMNWVKQYAAMFREYRVRTILKVYDQKREHYQNLLK